MQTEKLWVYEQHVHRMLRNVYGVDKDPELLPDEQSDLNEKADDDDSADHSTIKMNPLASGGSKSDSQVGLGAGTGNKSDLGADQHDHEQAEMQQAVSAEMSNQRFAEKREAIVQNVKQLFRDTKTNGDAFYFGQRMITAMVLSTFIMVFTCYIIVVLVLNMRDSVQKSVPSVPLDAVYSASYSVTRAYYDLTGTDMSSTDMGWIDMQADGLHSSMTNLGDAILGSMMVSCCFLPTIWC